MTLRRFMLIAMAGAAALPASALAQIAAPGSVYAAPASNAAPNGPADAPISGPAPAYGSPVATGEAPLPHDGWVVECQRRLNAVHVAEPQNIPQICEQWWGHFTHGGAPNVSYGYAIPVTLTPAGPICQTKQVVTVTKRVTRHVVKRAAVHHRKPAHRGGHDKRVKL